MKLLEYEAKDLLKQSKVTVPEAQLVRTGAEAPSVSLPVVLKVQIPVGGRGKAGGIQPVSTAEGFEQTAKELLSKPIKGYVASTLLAEEQLEIQNEHYLSYVIDRSQQSAVLLAHRQGGVDIETTTAEDSSGLLRIPLSDRPDNEVATKLLEHYQLDDTLRNEIHDLLSSLWEAFTANDALLLEINPLVLTKDNRLLCADAKIELDDAAAFRHPDWDFEQKPQKAQFVVLDEQGDVASMANGAGLAMATVDAIKGAGATPANFLDIGGGTNTEGMVEAFKAMTEMPSVRAIVINVFAGITRCDEVAQAIVIARERFENLPPLFIRLAGTNEQQGKQILTDNNIATLSTLQECVQAATEELN